MAIPVTNSTFCRELGRDVPISDHFPLPVSVSATAQNLSLYKKFSLGDEIS